MATIAELKDRAIALGVDIEGSSDWLKADWERVVAEATEAAAPAPANEAAAPAPADEDDVPRNRDGLIPGAPVSPEDLAKILGKQRMAAAKALRDGQA